MAFFLSQMEKIFKHVKGHRKYYLTNAKNVQITQNTNEGEFCSKFMDFETKRH